MSVHPYGLRIALETERVVADPAFQGISTSRSLILDSATGEAPMTLSPTLVMGVELRRALGGGPGALPFRFLAGERSQAVAELGEGRRLSRERLVRGEQRSEVGDRIPVAVPGVNGPTNRV